MRLGQQFSVMLKMFLIVYNNLNCHKESPVFYSGQICNCLLIVEFNPCQFFGNHLIKSCIPTLKCFHTPSSDRFYYQCVFLSVVFFYVLALTDLIQAATLPLHFKWHISVAYYFFCEWQAL